MFYFYIPVMDHKEMTQRCVKQLVDTVVEKDDFCLFIVDNCSEPKYTVDDFAGIGVATVVINNKQNWGMFYPLVQVEEFTRNITRTASPDDLFGAIHNDVFVYEVGWDIRVKQAFRNDPLLGLIGFCGSGEVDICGGRGCDTKCFFAGRIGQDQRAGRRITGLEPAAILDSLAMVFKRQYIPNLNITTEIAPYHFYDKILPLRLVDQGLHVAVLGVEVDHMGGQTGVGLGHRFDPFAQKWCDERGIVYGPGHAPTAIYVEAERRFFAEFGPKGLIPCRVLPDYTVVRMPNMACNPNGAHPQNQGRTGF